LRKYDFAKTVTRVFFSAMNNSQHGRDNNVHFVRDS